MPIKAPTHRAILRATGGGPLPVLQYAGIDLLRGISASTPAEGPWERVEVHIAASKMSSTNLNLRGRQLWGSDVYTDDSDLVAVLMHTGYYTVFTTHPPPSVVEARVVVQLMPRLSKYESSSRNGIRSRAWGAKMEGASYKVVRCWLLTTSGEVEMAAGLEGVPLGAPTFTPAAADRTHTTRATANADRRARPMQEVTLCYNLCNEPWLKYHIGAVADRGLKPSQWTCARLTHDVLYVETRTRRYEISKILPRDGAIESEVAAEAVVENGPELFRFSPCQRLLPMGVMRVLGMPLPEQELTRAEGGDVYTTGRWEEFKWANNGMYFRGRLYPLIRLHFARRKPLEPPSDGSEGPLAAVPVQNGARFGATE